MESIDRELINVIERLFKLAKKNSSILILDKETSNALSYYLPYSAILDYGFLDVISLSSDLILNEEYRGIQAIVFISFDGLDLFTRKLGSIKFLSDVIVILNESCSNDSCIRKIARDDANSRISHYIEVSLKFKRVTTRILTCGVDIDYKLLSDCILWGPREQHILTYIKSSIQSMIHFLSQSKNFSIDIYTTKDSVAKLIGNQINFGINELKKSWNLLMSKNADCNNKHVKLVLLNRLDDLRTPFTFPWIYENMIYEYLNVNDNIINIQNQKFFINDPKDYLYRNLKYLSFGELCDKIKNMKKKTYKDDQNYSEVKFFNFLLYKHLFITHELTRIVNQNKLFNFINFDQNDIKKNFINNHPLPLEIEKRLKVLFNEPNKLAKKSLSYNQKMINFLSIHSHANNLPKPLTEIVLHKIKQNETLNSDDWFVISEQKPNAILKKTVVMIFYIGGISVQDTVLTEPELLDSFDSVLFIGNEMINTNLIIDNYQHLLEIHRNSKA